jgi:hypothetical protein
MDSALEWDVDALQSAAGSADGDPSFESAAGLYAGIFSQDAAVESSQLYTLACSLMKIANDLRRMNSGPLAGIGEIERRAIQPGTSIMPGAQPGDSRQWSQRIPMPQANMFFDPVSRAGLLSTLRPRRTT